VITYFIGYAIYGGYISRFTGGSGAFSISKLEFQLTDLITLLPNAVYTTLVIIKQTFFNIVKSALFYVLIQIVAIGAGFFLGTLLRSFNAPSNNLVSQLSLFAFTLVIGSLLWITQPLSAYPNNWYTAGYEHRDNDEAHTRSYPEQQDDNRLPDIG
jgi:hypothetical protein